MKVERLVVGKGRTSKAEDAEEWMRQYYEIQVLIEDPAELEVGKANLEGLIDGWLSASMSKSPATQRVSFPNIDLHELEHDEAWRSWRKNEKGQCTFPAQEGQSGWLRIKNAGNTVLTLVQAMRNQGLKTVSLGLFEYKLSGEDFLQRRPLRKPEENDLHTRM